MATEQTISIGSSGDVTQTHSITLPFIKKGDLAVYISKGKIEEIEVVDKGAGYTNRARNAAEKLIFSGGDGTAPDLWITVGQDANNSGRIDGSIYGTDGTELSPATALVNTNLNVGSGYTTSPNISLTNLDGGEGGQLTAKIYAKKTADTHYSISESNKTITFTGYTLVNSDKILIKRVTDVTTAANTFNAGSTITAADLNSSFDQIRHKVEELPEVTSTAVTDGVKDDIAVLGNNWTIVDNAVTQSKILDDNVTYAKIQDIVTGNRVLGRASAGEVQEVQVATDMVADNAITLPKIADVAQNTLLGRTASGTGDVSAIQLQTGMIADNAVTPSKTNLSIVQGDIVYGTANDAWDRLAKGTAGQHLRTNKLGVAPEWFTPNVQSNVYVKSYGIASGGITEPNAAATVSGNLTAKEFHDTPITVTITPQISSSLIQLSVCMSYESTLPDYQHHFRIKAEVLNSSNVVQSTSYLTNNYNGSAIHNSGDGSSGYENKGTNLHVGIEGSNRIPTLHPGAPSWDDADVGTPASLNIPSLLHTHGINTVSTSNKIKYTIQIFVSSASVVYINRTQTDADTATANLVAERGVSWFTAQETMGTITVDI